MYYIFNGDAAVAGTWPAWFGSLGALSTSFLVIPIITFLSQRLGKKNTFLLSQSISLLGYISFWWCFNPDNPYLMLLPLPLFAFGIGSLFTMMMSMTADVCDLNELNTGIRREGVFGAIYWWMVSVEMALAGYLAGILLKASGFDIELATPQSERTLLLLRIFDVGVPMATSAIAIWIMATYKITETKAHEIREELERRRGKPG